MKTEIHYLEPSRLETFLSRKRRADGDLPSETSLAGHLVEILSKANEFVPSEAGSILLDNPYERTQHSLTFIAAFGEKAEGLVGKTLSIEQGIAGHVYRSGSSYVTPNAQEDQRHYSEIDRETDFRTESLIAIPIRLGDRVCGVLELIRNESFTQRNLELLEIFASYISISIQNVLDARMAHAIARQDNLTGLYNDRYLHVAVLEAVTDCAQRGVDLGLIFVDLDYFKRVNDSHGHLAGSQVLREIGRLLKEATANIGFVARYGGDEFVVVLPEAPLDRSVEVAEAIRTRIEEHTLCATAGDIYPVALHLRGQTASLGVASLQRHTSSQDDAETAKTTLLHLADSAMYVAKETGRNRTAIAGEPVARSAPRGVIQVR